MRTSAMGRGLVKCGHLRIGGGVGKGVFFADVLCGRPLTLLLFCLRCLTAYHIKCPPTRSITQILFASRHHISSSFVAAKRQHGPMSYILSFFLTAGCKKHSFIRHRFFTM